MTSFNRTDFYFFFGTVDRESGSRNEGMRMGKDRRCVIMQSEGGWERGEGEGGKRGVEEPSRGSGEMSEVSLSRDAFDSYVKSGSPQLKVAPFTLEEAEHRTNTLRATYELLSHFTQQNIRVLHSIVYTMMLLGFVNIGPLIWINKEINNLLLLLIIVYIVFPVKNMAENHI